MNEELTADEQAGVAAVDCIMPGMIAAVLEPDSERLNEMVPQHVEKHWTELTDAGKLAAFVYLAGVMGQHCAGIVKDGLAAFAAGSDAVLPTFQGWPIRTDGGR